MVATALAENAASIRVKEKAGLTPENRYLHDNRLEAVKYALENESFTKQADATAS